MSEATLRLVEGFFEVEPLGPQLLKGVSAPIAIYRVLRPSAGLEAQPAFGQMKTTVVCTPLTIAPSCAPTHPVANTRT